MSSAGPGAGVGPRQTIERFYAAFARLDADTMAACYAEDAHFDDPVFFLAGRRHIGGMWGMLCEATRAKGMAHWKLQAGAITGRSAHWEAWYSFSRTGRLVHNVIEASFEVGADGLIRRHTDRFDFWRWARQALGAPGWLLGWTPMLRRKVRGQAAAGLQQHLARSG